ncbi:MAG: HAMP domain-containing protein [Gemmatimonadaceae bacterium]|nr:HAMP domain-containing protein [Gemmatimonadaceae bacterium]
MNEVSGPNAGKRLRWLGRLQLFTSLKAEMALSLAIMGTAALSLAAINVLIIESLPVNRFGTLFLGVLILGDVVIFVGFGAYKVQGLVLDPLDAVVATTEAIAAGDLTRRVPPGSTREFARLAASVNRMTSRLLEEQAQRAHLEKVASVGRLAAGVAHEIGNPLGAIAGYTHILRGALRGNEDAAEALDGIERESGRIDRIVRSMLDYARPRRRTAESVDLNAVARRAVALLEDQGAMRGVRTTLDLEPDLPRVVGDGHELEQMLVNLLLNAVDALDGDGTVTIASASVSFAEARAGRSRRKGDAADFAMAREHSARVRAWLNTVGEPERVVVLVVADNGPGIPWSESERIFDPFFTTKAPGKGTGLGLAIVARIVEGIGGTIWVRPSREGGAAFVIYIPVVRPDALGGADARLAGAMGS